MGSMVMGTIAFETALGRCGVGWSEAGITGVLLPGARGVPGRVAEDAGELPAFVLRAIEGMRAVLAGAADDLRDIPVDDRGIYDFRRAVYAATRQIAPGGTWTYGQIARAIDRPDAARDVGVALSRNPTRSSSRAIGSSPQTGRSPASRHPAASRPSGGCSSSKAHRDTASCRCSADRADGSRSSHEPPAWMVIGVRLDFDSGRDGATGRDGAPLRAPQREGTTDG